MPETILLVDDDKEFIREFKDCFVEFNVIGANCGEEALNILKKPNEIDLVMLDIRMPGQNGIEILKRIREIEPGQRIVILTGYSSKDTAIEALKAHADDYIEKPLDVFLTRQIIEKMLDAKKEKFCGDAGAKIEKVIVFTQRNYRRNVRLKEAAARVYLSPKYLSRLFKQKTGKSFIRYKLEIKIKKIKELLETTAYTVDQLSDMFGYQNAESLIRIFRKNTGCTPGEYRKRAAAHKKTHFRFLRRPSDGKSKTGQKRL